MPRGMIDSTTYLDLPSNIDQAYLLGLQMASGLKFTEMLAIIESAMATVNAGVDPLIADLAAPWTTEAIAQGGDDSTMRVERRAQYTIARPQLVDSTAHQLAINGVDISIGFTEKGLQRISRAKFQTNVNAVAKALRRGFRADALYRLFSTEELAVDPEARSNATSPGFAGSGTGGNAFVGVYPDGSAASGGLTMYGSDTTANRDYLIAAFLTELKRWHPAPFDLVGSQAFIDAIRLDTTNYVDGGSSLIRQGVSVAEALVDTSKYVGVYMKDIRVQKPVLDWTSDHGVLFKSYGQFNSLNPLVPRYDPLETRDAYIRSRELFPLDLAVANWTYGWNINNRIGAAVIRIAASGGYSAPTIIG